jgi:hypothetical protein
VFDNPYQFTKVGSKRPHNIQSFVKTHIYSFRAEKTRYVVEVEEYSFNIFIIKFYRKSDTMDPLKFNVLTNEFKCSKIIATCVHVLLHIHRNNSNASFGFLGANTITGNYEEAKESTQRLNIYKKVMMNLIGDTFFEHHIDIIHSTYLMANKSNVPMDGFVSTVKKLFEEIYPSLED